MNIQQDFEELFTLFGKHDVGFMVVGGYAVAFHGAPRFTKDIDIFYDRSAENIKRIRKALLDFGFTEKDVPADLFEKEGNIVAFGVEPLRIDLLNRIDGVAYSEAAANRVAGQYGKALVYFIGKKELLKNKTSTSRQQDKIDAANLS